MRSFIIIALFALALAHPPRLVEIAKEVNAMHTTWVADETIPTRDFTEFIGALKGGNIPVKKPVLRGDLPKEFDAAANWPQCPSIKEIRDQSVCGSCWAVGAAAAATDRWCIATEGKVQDRLSSLDILSCCEYCGKGCQGGYPIEAWNSFVDEGVSTGGAYGSQDWCDTYPFPKCEHHGLRDFYPECGEFQPTPESPRKCQEGYPVEYAKDKHFFKEVFVVLNGVDAIKAELMETGPLEAVFDVYEDFLTYKSGIYQHVSGERLGGHAAKLVGWGVENGVEYWKLANSWNENWGENGYFRIVLGKDECHVEDMCLGGFPKL